MGFLSSAFHDIKNVAEAAFRTSVNLGTANAELGTGIGAIAAAKKYLSTAKSDVAGGLRGFKPAPPNPVAALPLVAPNPDDPTATAASLLNQQRMYANAGYAGTILSSANGGAGSSGNTLG